MSLPSRARTVRAIKPANPASPANGSMKAGERQDNNIMESHEERNAGEAAQIRNAVQGQVRSMLTSGKFLSESGKAIRVMEQTNNQLLLSAGDVSARTSMKLSGETAMNRTRLWANLSNGRMAEVKVMPDAASEKALERLRLNVCSEQNNCSIVLKEVQKDGNLSAAYELRAHKETRLFGLFRKTMPVEARVSAENGELIQSSKPWWAFLAAE